MKISFPKPYSQQSYWNMSATTWVDWFGHLAVSFSCLCTHSISQSPRVFGRRPNPYGFNKCILIKWWLTEGDAALTSDGIPGNLQMLRRLYHPCVTRDQRELEPWSSCSQGLWPQRDACQTHSAMAERNKQEPTLPSFLPSDLLPVPLTGQTQLKASWHKTVSLLKQRAVQTKNLDEDKTE